MHAEVLLTSRPIRNPSIVLREEFDDWGLLFDPEQGIAYGINPVGIFIWKQLDGTKTPEDIQKLVADHFDQVPETSLADVGEFIQTLVDKGYAGFELKHGR
jgi:SynChlorMet cassette protein ScmD